MNVPVACECCGLEPAGRAGMCAGCDEFVAAGVELEREFIDAFGGDRS